MDNKTILSECSDKYITKLAYKTAEEIYGKTLPKIVATRLKKELSTLVQFGFSAYYQIAHELAKKAT